MAIHLHGLGAEIIHEQNANHHGYHVLDQDGLSRKPHETLHFSGQPHRAERRSNSGVHVLCVVANMSKYMKAWQHYVSRFSWFPILKAVLGFNRDHGIRKVGELKTATDPHNWHFLGGAFENVDCQSVCSIHPAYQQRLQCTTITIWLLRWMVEVLLLSKNPASRTLGSSMAPRCMQVNSCYEDLGDRNQEKRAMKLLW